MSAFFDTNILIYAQQAGAKADRARALIELERHGGEHDDVASEPAHEPALHGGAVPRQR